MLELSPSVGMYCQDHGLGFWVMIMTNKIIALDLMTCFWESFDVVGLTWKLEVVLMVGACFRITASLNLVV